MNVRLKFFAVAVGLIAVGVTVPQLHGQMPYGITVKAGGLRQSFAGFGASQVYGWGSWQATPRNQMADLVFRDLKMNVLRMWVTTGDSISVADMLAEFNTNFVASGAIADIMSRGVTTLLLAPAAGGGIPPPASISLYADNLAELILEIKMTFGVSINVTGISNEPGTWTVANIVDCVNYLRASLDARGLNNVKIIAPESSGPTGAVPIVDALYKNSTAWAGLYGIASHSYGSVLPNNDLELRKDTKQWWMTEASDDANENAEDESRACSILARYLCEMNHGVNEWIFFIGMGQKPDVTTAAGTTAFLTIYDVKTARVITFLKYYYFKQALTTFDVGCVFRQCASASEGDMFLSSTGSTNQNPAINAAAAYNPDGSWGISVVNDTGVTGSPATSTNVFYSATSFNVTLAVEELVNTPSLNFTVYRSRAGDHFVNSGTITLVNGIGAISIAPKELVSLRSGSTAVAIPPVPNALTPVLSATAPVALIWNNTVKATSWHVKRATLSGGPYTTIATTTTTSYNDNTALNGTVYYYVVSALGSAGESANSSEVVASPAPFPWSNIDIGPVGVPGSFSVSGSGVFITNGAGTTIGGLTDSFNYTYRTLTGDGTLIARLSATRLSVNGKVGIVMSETLGAGSKCAFVVYNFNGVWLKAFMAWRTTEGTNAQSTLSTVSTVPTWFKLVRSGSTFTGYASTDGVTWSTINSAAIPMANTITMGLVNCSSNTTYLCMATLDNVSAPCAAPIGLTETASQGQIRIGWTACLGAASYNIKRASVSGGPYSTIGAVTAPTLGFTDNAVAPGSPNCYVVTAVNPNGESAVSQEPATVFLSGSLALSATAGLPIGTSLPILSVGGTATVTGTFSGHPQNHGFYASGNWWRMNYTGGDGNDVVATVTTAPAAPTLAVGTRPSTGTLTILGAPNYTYSIESSTDLIHWTPLDKLVSPSLPVQWTDSNSAAFPRRFYRVRLGD